MVSIAAFKAVNSGSIPGRCSFVLQVLKTESYYEFEYIKLLTSLGVQPEGWYGDHPLLHWLLQVDGPMESTDQLHFPYKCKDRCQHEGDYDSDESILITQWNTRDDGPTGVKDIDLLKNGHIDDLLVLLL